MLSSPAPTGREFLGRGWGFPIGPDSRGGLRMSRAERDIEEAIWIVLSTAPGERVMLPEFGCGIQELVFRPNSDHVHGLVAAGVRQGLLRWEPRIDVLDVSVETPDGQPNLMLIRVDYRIRGANSIHNIVYPFYVAERGV